MNLGLGVPLSVSSIIFRTTRRSITAQNLYRPNKPVSPSWHRLNKFWVRSRIPERSSDLIDGITTPASRRPE